MACSTDGVSFALRSHSLSSSPFSPFSLNHRSCPRSPPAVRLPSPVPQGKSSTTSPRPPRVLTGDLCALHPRNRRRRNHPLPPRNRRRHPPPRRGEAPPSPSAPAEKRSPPSSAHSSPSATFRRGTTPATSAPSRVPRSVPSSAHRISCAPATKHPPDTAPWVPKQKPLFPHLHPLRHRPLPPHPLRAPSRTARGATTSSSSSTSSYQRASSPRMPRPDSSGG